MFISSHSHVTVMHARITDVFTSFLKRASSTPKPCVEPSRYKAHREVVCGRGATLSSHCPLFCSPLKKRLGMQTITSLPAAKFKPQNHLLLKEWLLQSPQECNPRSRRVLEDPVVMRNKNHPSLLPTTSETSSSSNDPQQFVGTPAFF